MTGVQTCALPIWQRQLAAWLPPFYPYSRKFLSLQSRTKGQKPPVYASQDWNWIGGEAKTVRIAVRIDESLEREINRHVRTLNRGLSELLILNAVPVIQTRQFRMTLQSSEVGDLYKATQRGIKGCFGATAHEEIREQDETGQLIAGTRYHPCEIRQEPTDVPGVEAGTCNLIVTGNRPETPEHLYQARIYYGSYGEEIARPAILNRRQESFETPLPPVGGLNLSCRTYEGEGARGFWYHSLLRASQLTAGDVQQTLMEIPVLKKYFDLPSLQLRLEKEPWRDAKREITPWENALWPSLVTGEATLEMRANYFSASRIALIPVMCLTLTPRPQLLGDEVPDFLLQDLACYAASVISRYFMVGWYRIEGKVEGLL